MGITRKIADAAQYMAEVPKNNWTFGSLLSNITNGEFKPHSWPMNRAARLVERGVFAAGMVIGAGASVYAANFFPLVVMTPVSKFAGVLAGGVTHVAAEGVATITHALERKVARTALKLGIKPKPEAPKPPVPQKAAKPQKAPKPLKPGKYRKPREDRMLHKFAKTMDWLNDYTGNKYTLGNALRKIVGMPPSEAGLHYSRIGRFFERVGTLGALTALVVMGGPIAYTPTFVFMLAACKMTGVATGAAALFAGRFVGGVAHALDHRLNRISPQMPTGATPEEVAMTGARNARQNQPSQQATPTPQQQPANDKTGAAPEQQTMRDQFKQSAAKPQQGLAGSRIFSANGPRDASAYGLGDVELESPITQALKAAQQQQQQRRV